MTSHGPLRRISRPMWWVLSAFVFLTAVTQLPVPAALIPSAERTLYFKLPLEGVRFHWKFLNRDDFLAGELTLRIIDGERDQTLVVFRDGKISDGWKMIGDESRDSSFYFGFATDQRVRTSHADSLVITLVAVKDLMGRGPYHEGILPKGTWQMTGTYSSIFGGLWNPMHALVLRSDPPVAYMQCWDGVWPIRITRNAGWMGANPDEDQGTGLFRRLRLERGVDGRRCRSHI